MWIILAFWTLLPVPGLACLSRFDLASFQGGALSVFARAYLVSLALLTPVSVLGYIAHWPLGVLSVAYLVLVLLGGLYLLRQRARARAPLRRPQLREFRPIALLGAALLLFDVWLGARVGSHVAGDAGFHVARIRMLLELGLGSWDPLADGLHFEPVYHTNLYHALIAVSAQISGSDPGAAWIWAWPFAKLLAAAGSYELGLQVLGKRWLAWTSAIAASAWFATQSVLTYPNMIGPFGLLALGLSLAIAALSSQPSFRNAAWLGAAALAIAQTHMLYASLLMLVVAPLLLLRLGLTLVRRQRGRPELLAALLFLASPLPWLAVPAWSQVEALLSSVAHAQPQAPAAAPAANPAAPLTSKQRKAGLFIEHPGGGVSMNPRDFLGASLPITQVLFTLALFGVLARRAAPLAAIAIAVTLGVFLCVPALCTGLVKLLAARWVLARFAVLFEVLCIGLLPASAMGLIALAVQAAARRLGAASLPAWGAALLQLLGCAAGLGYAQLHAPRGEPWTIAQTWQAALANQARTHAERISERARFFAEQVTPRASVMAPVMLDYYLPMHCNCRALAFRGGRGERGVTDIDARREAVERFYARDTAPAERAAILERYQLRYVYSSARRAPRLARDLAPRVIGMASSGPDAIIRLAP